MSASFESTTTNLNTTRLAGPTELRRKAHSRLAEKIDPVRTRHKPLSILRQEAKRILDHLLDQEAPSLSRPERDRFCEDVLAEAICVGSLEDLFRDEAIKEILILAHNQIISKKNDIWLPTSARFRDAEQFRSVLAHFTAIGENLLAAGPGCSGLDLRLPNGFRLLAIMPPAIMEVPSQVLLVRQAVPVVVIATPKPASAALPHPSSVISTPAPQTGASGSVSISLTHRPITNGSGGIQYNLPAKTGDQSSGRHPIGPVVDPYTRFRQKVSDRIVVKFASAGVYDLNLVPLPDLRRIVLAHVMEYCDQDKMGYDDATQERLALEILANMNR